MSVEADRQAIIELPIDVEMLQSLREAARLHATHYSTQIEGNRLTEAQVRETLSGARFPGRERDTKEVRNYYRAIEEVERLSESDRPIEELDVRRIHGLVIDGRATPTPYRDGQNVIRDSVSGNIVYMPPEAKDVSELMSELTAWINSQIEEGELPAPLIAALAHYQFATVHPYYDGNGRTARLLTNLILHRSGYGLKGIYSLEDYYAQNLVEYYRTLDTGTSHNYYFGRAEADATGFVNYFCVGMAESFAAVRAQAVRAAKRGSPDYSPLLRKLDPRQRRVLSLFRRQAVVNTQDIAEYLGIAVRSVLNLVRAWPSDGFLELSDTSRRSRSYRLGADFERLISGSED
jgi:Fic family protein